MHNSRKHLVLTLLACACVCLPLARGFAQQNPAATPASIDTLRQQFQDPPDDARIMMRWWWFGSAVTNEELERELRTMKQGGIGGVEVQATYPLAIDDLSAGFKNLPYLSDGFLDALRFTSHKTRELGLRMDLTLGSGWPYGGPTVPVNEAAGMLRVERVHVDSDSWRVPLPSIGNGEKLIAIFLGPAGAHKLEEFLRIDVTSEGAVALPDGLNGPGELLFFIASRSGQQVKRPALGAEGFVVDHYDSSAIDHYLHSVGDRLMQAFDQDKPYAVFCDSLEVYNSDWTADFLAQFQQRRGYDLRPYLPALAADLGPRTAEVRYDWARTLTELFNERFATRVHQWAQQNHTRFRMQGYGIPPATISSGALVDLPEGEGAQWNVLSATRWASSASHIYGVPVTSSETWTWLHSPVFRATPLDVKAEADHHFLSGINQLIGHGWPYTAPGVAYPGWRFYAAAVFDEKNPWWTVMPDVARYLQRMSFLLRQGSPVADVAIYLPTADAMAHFRLGRVNLFETLRDELGPDLLAQVLAAGFNADFFDDDALRNAGRIEPGSLALGSNRYRAVILPNVEHIPLEAYRKIEEFARAGGIVIATRRQPDGAPGLNHAQDSATVREISARLFGGTNQLARMVIDENALATELKLHLPDMTLSPAAPAIGFVHRHAADAEIYFVANTSNTRQQTTATFRTAATHAEAWNALTGISTPVDAISVPGAIGGVALDLAPYESRVLVFTTAAKPAPRRSQARAPSNSALDLSVGWHVTFGSNGPSKDMTALSSWTDNPQTRYLSGVATYEKTFSLPNGTRSGQFVLDFGPGTALAPQPLRSGMQAWFEPPIREAAVVYVNGTRAGSLWCPPYQLDITSLLHPGENRLHIEVANLATNAMAGERLPDYRLLNLRYGERFQAQDMDKVQPVPAGMLGPVRLITRTP